MLVSTNALAFIGLISVECVPFIVYVENRESEFLPRLFRLVGFRNRKIKEPGEGL
jgi:hypothetical protein